MRAKDASGHQINLNTAVVSKRYAFSNYVLDPCKYTWSKAVRILAIAKKFISMCKAATRTRRPGEGQGQRGDQEAAGGGRVVVLTADEIADSEMYFFRKATLEVVEFCKPKDYRHFSQKRDGILYFSGRLLDSGGIKALEQVMFDLNPVTFCRPLVDRHSPIAYSIMLETHQTTVHHLQ